MGFFDLFKSKPKHPPELEETLERIKFISFPGGEKQIRKETEELSKVINGKLSKKDTEGLLKRIKALLIIAEDKSEARIIGSILAGTSGKLSQYDAKQVYQYITGYSSSLYTGGDGSSKDNPVIINATRTQTGVAAEYNWIASKYGTQDQDWKIVSRFHGNRENKSFEIFKIELKDGSEHTIHFDITSFYGKL